MPSSQLESSAIVRRRKTRGDQPRHTAKGGSRNAPTTDDLSRRLVSANSPSLMRFENDQANRRGVGTNCDDLDEHFVDGSADRTSVETGDGRVSSGFSMEGRVGDVDVTDTSLMLLKHVPEVEVLNLLLRV